jgi:FkbM family methyltransferase
VTPQTFTTPNGNAMTLFVREDTNDAALATGILSEDEYRLKGRHLFGWALDIGAHIGTVAIALAVDHPGLRVIAVEPVPDNADLIRFAVAANGLTERVFVEESGAAGAGATKVDVRFNFATGEADAGYVHENRYVGNIWGPDAQAEVVAAKAVTLSDLMTRYLVGTFALVKVDCEGCEWDFLTADMSAVMEIIGEWHSAPFSRLRRLLRATHEVELVNDHGGIGIFQAFRR